MANGRILFNVDEEVMFGFNRKRLKNLTPYANFILINLSSVLSHPPHVKDSNKKPSTLSRMIT